MEDGSGFWHLWVFIFLLFIEALVYGFSAAVQSVSDSKLEKLVEQGEEKRSCKNAYADSQCKY